jgi:UDP-N-acetylmuramoyl-L-alanyl-D-glutamate--2,6-diaminopimelate ligase
VSTIGSLNTGISGISFDSRLVKPNDLFIAIKGTQTDGHRYIRDALKKGARAIVCEEIPEDIPDNKIIIQVRDSAEALGIISSNFFDSSSESLKLIGVTGTNGKTTIVTMLYSLVRSLGYPAALLSTIENQVNGQVFAATHTTPDPLQINRFLKESVDRGCEFCFMEVSSHALAQKRIHGLHFDGGIFTNITHDHLDYHSNFADYLKAKKSFFDQLPENSFALTNVDDRNGRVMIQNTRAKQYSYGLQSPSDYHGLLLENSFEGLVLNINDKELHTGLIGRFNAYNLLATYATAMLLNLEESEVLAMLSTLEPAEGRFDRIDSKEGILGIIDYAHTPDALKNVLETINSIRKGNEQIITVIGAGGDRDTMKRPKMAGIAGKLSNLVILTSDNPRTEDPQSILNDMKKGIEVTDSRKFISIIDRREAIKTAATMAKPGDIILVAGKGHEKYQDINGVKLPFDDKEVLQGYLNKAE